MIALAVEALFTLYHVFAAAGAFADPRPPGLEGADALLKQGTTSPPARFTEDTLLSAMEHASAEDFAALESVERTGLGTPATRAATIEKLVKSGFVERKKKQLLPTEKGLALSWAMPDQLKSAKLTAEWEERLGAVERGELSPEDFMDGITAMLAGLVQSYRNVNVAPSALSTPLAASSPFNRRSKILLF